MRLGGTTLWASDPQILESAVDALSQAIQATTGTFLTCTKAVLKKNVAQSVAYELPDDRIFNAVLGKCLRQGMLDELMVSSINDKPFRVLFSQHQRMALLDAISIAKIHLSNETRSVVRDVEARIFRSRAYSTWSSTSHVLGHLSYAGFARQIDGMTYELVRF